MLFAFHSFDQGIQSNDTSYQFVLRGHISNDQSVTNLQIL
jgi:hypothetical protein